MPAVREISTGRRMSTVTLSIPQGSQLSLLRSLSRNMGWKMKVSCPKPAVKEDPTLMTKEEYFAKIERAKEQARNGELGPSFGSAQELIDYLRTL